MKQKIILKKPLIRNKIIVTKKRTEFFKNEINEYYDSSGYLSYSESKKKYVILGTNKPRNGLVECPVCHSGQLMVIRSRRTRKRFMGCSNFYNGCKASSPLIQKAALKGTKSPCDSCGWPIVVFRYSRKQKWIKKCSNIVCKNMPKS